MIERAPATAAASDYDLIVVGGGIHGAALTLEAARRGLRPLLLERDDFGGATSWNSLRILHGGLRYLQSLDLGRYRESVAERHWFMRNFPDQVVPLACLMPLYGEGLRRPSVFALAFRLDALLSRHRNDGLASGRELGRARVLDPAETRRLFPTLTAEGLRGGALWNDAWMPEAPRVLIEMLHWATAAGGRALNYTEAVGLRVDSGSVKGVTALDREGGGELAFRAPRVINCAGPWCREVASRFDPDAALLLRPTLGFNLLLDRTPPARVATAVSPPGQRRSYFLVPWRDRLMAGTYYTEIDTDTDPGRDPLEPGHAAVVEFLADLNRAAPELGLQPSDISRVLAGRLPATPAAPATPASKNVLYRHADHGGPSGLTSVSGVKYTTARSVAEKTLRAVLGRELAPVDPAHARPPATSWPTLEELEGSDPDQLAARLDRLATEESVVDLQDLLLRRSDLGLEPARGRVAAACISRLLRRQGSSVRGLDGPAEPGAQG